MSDTNYNERFDKLWTQYSSTIDENERGNPNYYNEKYSKLLEERGYSVDPSKDQIIKDNQNTKKDPTQPASSNNKDDKPGQQGSKHGEANLKETLFGLPPIANNDEVVGTLVKNSFPILKIREVELEPPQTAQEATKTTPKGEAYKFVVKNEGGMNYSISNEYGPSVIEDDFQKASIQIVSEAFQLARSNRLLHHMGKPLENMANTARGWANEAVKTGLNFMNESAKSTSPEKAKYLSPLAGGLTTIAQVAAQGLMLGAKIDIPNIWKGSSGPISYNGSIVLHCLYPDIDSEYEKSILMPLRILFRLASPHAVKLEDIGAEVINDILTYENPPYIEAEVDGIFKTKIGAITNLTVNIDHRYQSFSHGGRPFLINVSLTITDLYNVIVWNDEPNQYAPNGLDIVNTLRDHNRDADAVPAISDQLNFQFIPGSVFNYIGTAMTNAERLANAIGNSLNTTGFSTGILNTLQYVTLNQAVSISTQNEATVPDSIANNEINYEAWRRGTSITQDLYGNKIVSTGDAWAMTNISTTSVDKAWGQSILTSSNSTGSSLSSKWGTFV